MAKRISRRGFLKSAVAVGGGMAVLGGMAPLENLARAQLDPDTPERYYIFCYFGGGWDTLISLDPRDPRDFPSTVFSMQQTRIQPAYELLPVADADIVRINDELAFGPYMGEMINHAEKVAVVRGMNMETLAHEGGRRRFLTGKPPTGNMARGSSASTWLAGHLGRNDVIPNLSLRVEAYNKDMPNYATAMRVSSINDLLRALNPAQPAMDDRLRRQISVALGDAADCPSARRSRSWQTAEFARVKGQDVVSNNLGGQFDFMANTVEMEMLRDRYNIRRLDNSSSVSAALAVTAITSGVSRCVSVAITGGLDTHGPEWNRNQGPNQRNGWNAIARMVEDLESRDYGDGSSWLDHTTILAFSEFSRTPLLNARNGRDHHLTNSALLIGGGIKGGTVVGASSNVGYGSMAIDRRTGRPDPGGEVLRPEHILRTLYDEVGIDRAPDLRVDGLPTLLKS